MESAAPRGKQELFRAAFEAASIAMLMVDRDGRIALANTQAERLFGYGDAELAGRPLESLIAERARAGLGWQRPRPMGSGELAGVRKDGTEISLEIGLSPIDTAGGDVVLASIVDVSERRRTIEQLRERTAELTASLKERDVLLQEVHHRVKNNLQLISSLINMQMRRLQSDAPRAALSECRQRVEAISLIHQTLYQSRNYARVPFSDYVRSLAGSTAHVAGPRRAVDMRIDCDAVWLPVDRAVSCGLLLNELIANAMHACGEGQACRMELTLRRTDDGVRMSICGSSPLENGASNTFGMQLIEMLTQQIEGTLQSEGTTITIGFPLAAED